MWKNEGPYFGTEKLSQYHKVPEKWELHSNRTSNNNLSYQGARLLDSLDTMESKNLKLDDVGVVKESNTIDFDDSVDKWAWFIINLKSHNLMTP